MVKSGRRETLILAASRNQRLPLTSCTLTCCSHDQFDMDWRRGDPPKPSREPKSFCVWLLKMFEGGKLSYPSFIHSRVLKFFFLLIVSLLGDPSFPTTDRSSWALFVSWRASYPDLQVNWDSRLGIISLFIQLDSSSLFEAGSFLIPTLTLNHVSFASA